MRNKRSWVNALAAFGWIFAAAAHPVAAQPSPAVQGRSNAGVGLNAKAESDSKGETKTAAFTPTGTITIADIIKPVDKKPASSARVEDRFTATVTLDAIYGIAENALRLDMTIQGQSQQAVLVGSTIKGGGAACKVIKLDLPKRCVMLAKVDSKSGDCPATACWTGLAPETPMSRSLVGGGPLPSPLQAPGPIPIPMGNPAAPSSAAPVPTATGLSAPAIPPATPQIPMGGR